MIKRCVVESTNKAEIRPEERSEKAENFREIAVERATKIETDTRTESKGVGKLCWFMFLT